MKRSLGAIVCCLLLLAGCSEKKEEIVIAPEKIASAVAESQSGRGDLKILSGEVLEGYLQSCGLTEWEDAAAWTGEGMDGREITVVLLADESLAENAAQALEAHRQSRIGDFFGYAPEQAELLEHAQVLMQGRCSAFLACDDMEEAKKAFEACFDGEDVQVLSSQTVTAEPEKSAGTEPPHVEKDPPSPRPEAEPGPTQPEKSPAPSQPSEVETGMDISRFPKFDPPNDVDMTLYDNTAVVNAWKNGDESGLSEKDKAILTACREVFAEVISEGMTDFEKELAFHDWLIRNGGYDAQSRDNVAHIGQPNNNDPYGMLVGGYGICLGFATTFQLLMELADIECITVVGAAYDSTADHAWNMVKLDGEWYCVDVTWNNSGDSGNDVLKRQKATHRYFNVTSQYLRDTEHQWDYVSIPEATAEHYRWEGVGKLPT